MGWTGRIRTCLMRIVLGTRQAERGLQIFAGWAPLISNEGCVGIGGADEWGQSTLRRSYQPCSFNGCFLSGAVVQKTLHTTAPRPIRPLASRSVSGSSSAVSSPSTSYPLERPLFRLANRYFRPKAVLRRFDLLMAGFGLLLPFGLGTECDYTAITAIQLLVCDRQQ